MVRSAARPFHASMRPRGASIAPVNGLATGVSLSDVPGSSFHSHAARPCRQDGQPPSEVTLPPPPPVPESGVPLSGRPASSFVPPPVPESMTVLPPPPPVPESDVLTAPVQPSATRRSPRHQRIGRS